MRPRVWASATPLRDSVGELIAEMLKIHPQVMLRVNRTDDCGGEFALGL